MYVCMFVCVTMLLYSYMIVAIILLHSYFIHSLVFSVYFMIMNNQDGMTALHKAANGGFTEIVKILLDKGAEVNITGKVSHCIRVDVVLLIVVQSM